MKIIMKKKIEILFVLINLQCFPHNMHQIHPLQLSVVLS